MLRDRLVSAFILIPVVLGAVLLGGLVFFAVVAIALLLAGFEFFQMTQRAGHHPSRTLGLALILVLLLDAFLRAPGAREILAAGLVLSFIAGIFRRGEGWLVGWALTFAGALYVGILGSYFVLIRALPDGLLWTALVLLTAWADDTAAYLAGTRFGRHGFFTSISPKKTWEGAIAGLCAAAVVMPALGAFVGLPALPMAGFGLGVGIAGTLGDLAESVLKRQVGAKDSGAIVPGHGGLLDRIDSLLFAAAFSYWFLVFVWHVRA